MERAINGVGWKEKGKEKWRWVGVGVGGRGGRVCCWLCSRADRDRHTPTARITDPQQETHTHTLKHAKCKHTHRQTDMQGHTRNTCTHTRWWVGRVSTETHTMCGLAVATADAVHEYFSQTLWQSFHLHGPDVSSWNIYHTGPGRNRPQPHCVRAPVCVTFTRVCVFFVFMLNLGCASVCVCVYSSKWQYLFFSFRRRLPSGWTWSVLSSSPSCHRRWDTHTHTMCHIQSSFFSLLREIDAHRRCAHTYTFITVTHRAADGQSTFIFFSH